MKTTFYAFMALLIWVCSLIAVGIAAKIMYSIFMIGWEFF